MATEMNNRYSDADLADFKGLILEKNRKSTARFRSY